MCCWQMGAESYVIGCTPRQLSLTEHLRKGRVEISPAHNEIWFPTKDELTLPSGKWMSLTVPAFDSVNIKTVSQAWEDWIMFTK